jgi:hypothetical protein
MVFHASTGMSMMRMLPAAADAHMVYNVDEKEDSQEATRKKATKQKNMAHSTTATRMCHISKNT